MASGGGARAATAPAGEDAASQLRGPATTRGGRGSGTTGAASTLATNLPLGVALTPCRSSFTSSCVYGAAGTLSTRCCTSFSSPSRAAVTSSCEPSRSGLQRPGNRRARQQVVPWVQAPGPYDRRSAPRLVWPSPHWTLVPIARSRPRRKTVTVTSAFLFRDSSIGEYDTSSRLDLMMFGICSTSI